MWMVNPRIMCRQHLLGEHLELHMFAGAINKHLSLDGYLRNNLLEPASIIARHSTLVSEMTRRGYHHKSPLVEINTNFLLDTRIDSKKSLDDLLARCERCKINYSALI